MKKNAEFSIGHVRKLKFPIMSTVALLCLSLFIVSGANLEAQVNREEMQNLGPVEFVNYVGPYTRIETRAQIRAIGYTLGALIRTGQVRAGGSNRYFIISSISEEDGNKIDADIMGLGVDVGVDHVRNLRFIIQGYLEAAYEYTAGDAALLAEYITVYNAVYRGDVGYFGTRYKTPVMGHITADKAGLSIRYDEWPGRTLMLIPLGTGGPGSLSAIDTTTLIDPRVTEQLREEPDGSVDTRKGMVDLLERQSEEAGQQAATQREAIKEEEKKIAEERKELEQKKDDMSREEQAAARQELDERQEQLDEQKKEAEKSEQYAEQKADEAQRERENITQDQQAVINKGSDEPAAARVLAATILTPDTSLGRVVIIDPSTRKETKRSGLSTINARTIVKIDNRLFAIAGENRGNAAIRLVEINTESLEMAKQGDDDIAPTSLLWVNGRDIYAISSSGGNLYMSRFDMSLARLARSSVTVHPFASVFVDDGNLLTQRADGSALILNPSDLTERR